MTKNLLHFATLSIKLILMLIFEISKIKFEELYFIISSVSSHFLMLILTF